MPQIDCQSRPIGATDLAGCCVRLLEAAGLTLDNATLVADTLVEANLRGTDSHGVARLPHYLRRLRLGSVNARPQLVMTDLGQATGRVDGDHGLGQLAMHRAADEAVRLARSAGAGWVAVCDSSHCGALSYYGLQIARAGMIGLVFTHVDSMVLPFNARQAFCGTNPICITAPRSTAADDTVATGALCLDMATSKSPWNTVMNAAAEGVAIPPGWAVDAQGNDTTDPHAVVALQPFGDYKGSGLGLMIDIFCAMLSDAPFGPDIPAMYGDLSAPRRLGGLVGAIDIRRFVPLERFHARVTELAARWNALPTGNHGERVMFPGEPELVAKAQRQVAGIPLGLRTWEELERCAAEYGVAGLVKSDTAMQGPHWQPAATATTARQSGNP